MILFLVGSNVVEYVLVWEVREVVMRLSFKSFIEGDGMVFIYVSLIISLYVDYCESLFILYFSKESYWKFFNFYDFFLYYFFNKF